MSASFWKDEETELIKKLRPHLTTKEIKDVLEGAGYLRTLEAISKKARMSEVAFQAIGVPARDQFSKKELEALDIVLNRRVELPTESEEQELPGYHHPAGHHIRGVSTHVDARGNVISQWYKTQRSTVEKEYALKAALKEIPELVPKRIQATDKLLKNYAKDLLSVYPIGDPHLGMLAWGPESGENFDIKIATSQLCAAMKYLVDQADPTEEALIVNLGDFFHVDNRFNTTPKNHNPLDADGRWAKLIRVGLAVKVNLVELALQKHKNVKVICEIGNHDEHCAIFLAVALDAYFRNEPRVTVDLSPSKFHYHVFGQNLIGVHHGDTVKPKDLESVMAHDKPEEWGNTKNRYWYIGHIHHMSKHEFRGCSVESFRTLAPKDAWHHQMGYRSRCDMTKIMLHKEYGEIFRATVDSNFLKKLLKEQGK